MSNKVAIPFAGLSRYISWISAGALVLIAAFLRFFELGSLPPGLYTDEAQLGLQALQLADKGTLPGLTAVDHYAPLWTWLQAINVKIFGNSIIALRLWPALLGVAAVVFTWLWVRSWFDRRVAWLAAFTLAVTPWSITLSRNALVPALIICLVPATFWLATMAERRNSPGWYLAAGLVLSLDFLAGPLGWLIALSTLAVAAWRLAQRHELTKLTQPRLVGLGALALGLAGLAFMVGVSLPALKNLNSAIGFPANFGTFTDNIVRTLLMFNLRGDENFHHNFAPQPMLNAFLGLMFVAGLLFAISRLHQRRYQIVLTLFLVLLSPALISTIGTPNAARAAAALPVVALLVGLGISYMLNLWYMTFPINSAARSTGLAVIMVLLLLSLLQGYTQYFRAWAATNETYLAYHEPAVKAADYLNQHPFSGQRLFIGQPNELPVNRYLTYGKTVTETLSPSQLPTLPVGPGARQFIITATARDEAAKNLSVKFPGGKLRPQTSPFSHNEIFYIYEVGK